MTATDQIIAATGLENLKKAFRANGQGALREAVFDHCVKAGRCKRGARTIAGKVAYRVHDMVLLEDLGVAA